MGQLAQQTIPVPLVIGHEFVGEIVEIGSNVTDFQIGDRVSGEGHVVCGRLPQLHGRQASSLCPHARSRVSIAPGHSRSTSSCPMTNIWHHAADIPLEIAAIFDPFGNAVHTALAFPVLGEDVLITGAGPSESWRPRLHVMPARGKLSSQI